MLIINADDFGINQQATDNILLCFQNNRITSVSAMVFMRDSDRAAESAIYEEMDVGLHLNFTQKFTGKIKHDRLIDFHGKIATFLLKNKYNQLIYNPLLRNEFDYVYKAQLEEYHFLFGHKPSHIDGHRHMHLCSNMLFDKFIPDGTRVRRNFSFISGEKSTINRIYRSMVDKWLKKKYICTDYFFSIEPFGLKSRLQRILDLSRSANVELMVHPERPEEYIFLLDSDFMTNISTVKVAGYKDL